MQLSRSKPHRSLISLVSMIDVLMIMLVFFMVTSTYLNLDMMPMAENADTPETAPSSGTDASDVVLIRLAEDGTAFVQGRPLAGAQLSGLFADRLAQMPELRVIVLPSGGAPTQALVTLMDTATRAGVSRLRVIRLEALP